ncbi:hypothetical protein KIW84_024890 [Lathyrus oleraceus]|uniref:Uncharacterized protein n=1 Tax=Pisum sativum TaxID=3888 RepID=A0A9D4YHZ2_PEA|nr:hypothetical protein KIW84_024890 [Pisum sativum]
MGPRKLLASKKQKTSDAGPSFVPRPKVGSYSHDKFLGPEQKLGKSFALPLTHLNYEIVRELYVNVMPVEDQPYSFVTMVRGMPVSLSRDAIYAYLNNPLTLEGGALQVDVTRIISNEIKMIAKSSHRLGSKTHNNLSFSGMILRLCQRARIPLPAVVHETIDGVVGDRCIERYCVTKAANFFSTPIPPAQQQPFDERASCAYTWDIIEAN